MDRESFEYLFIHANSLAELALIKLVGEIEASAKDAPKLSEAEREAHLKASYDNYMKDAVYHPNGDVTFSPEKEAIWAEMAAYAKETYSDEDRARFLAEALAADEEFFAAEALKKAKALEAGEAALEASEAAPAVSDMAGADSASADGELDLGLYLQRGYAAKPQIAARVDACMAGIDMESLEMTMVFLPEDLTPITSELDANGLAKWLDLYLSDDFGVHEIVRTIRAWEFAAN